MIKDETNKLNLSSNRLSAIPYHILNCSNLEQLNCSHNRISEIPRLLIASRNTLLSLDMSFNRLHSLNESLFRLSRLSYLNLRKNFITSIPLDIEKLSSLATLDLGENGIKRLPSAISKLLKLKILLADRNCLDLLPDEVGDCRLEVLDVRFNRLERLPTTLHKLSHHLRVLNAEGNPLSSSTLQQTLPRGMTHTLAYLASLETSNGDINLRKNLNADFEEECKSRGRVREKKEKGMDEEAKQDFNSTRLLDEDDSGYWTAERGSCSQETTFFTLNPCFNQHCKQDKFQQHSASDSRFHYHPASDCHSPKHTSSDSRLLRHSEVDSCFQQNFGENLQTESSVERLFPLKRMLFKSPSLRRRESGDRALREDQYQHHRQQHAASNQECLKECEADARLRLILESHLNKVLPPHMSQVLRDGVILCEFANCVAPKHAITSFIHQSNISHQQHGDHRQQHLQHSGISSIGIDDGTMLVQAKSRRNLENFANTCRNLGVPEHEIFSVNLILEGDPSGMEGLAHCVTVFVERAPWRFADSN